MAESFFDYPAVGNYISNRYFQKKLADDKMLITTDHGAWIVLTQEEYGLLRKGKVEENPDLFNNLLKTGVLVSKDNIQDISQCFYRRNCQLTNGVNLHILTPTLRCNHSCIYCHAKSVPLDTQGHDMDEDTAKKIVDFIFQSPAKKITIEFQGGEPLANFPIVEYVIEYAKEKNKTAHKDIAYLIVSNLTMVDETILKYLIENKVQLCSSLDGPKKVHDRNRYYCDNKGSYNDVVHWLDIIMNDYKYNIHCLPTITRHSLPYAKEIVDEYVRLGFDRIRMRHLMNSGFANKRWKEIGYTPEEFLAFWKESVAHCMDITRKGTNFLEGMSVMAARKFLSKDRTAYTCFSSPCGAGLEQASYNFNGDIYACDEARSYDVFRLGNVKDNTFKEVYTGQQALTLVDLSSSLSSHCDFCVWHAYCGNCLVTTYGEQKNLIPKLPVNNECKIRKGIIEHAFNLLWYDKEARKTLIDWSATEKGV